MCVRQFFSIDELEPLDDDLDVGDSGLRGSGRHGDGRLTQAVKDILGADGAHPPALEKLLDRSETEAPGLGGRWCQRPKFGYPGLGQVALDLEELRKVAPELLSLTVDEAGSFTGQFVGDTGPFTKLDHFRRVRREPAKEAAVRAQCIGQGEGVTAVVLGTGRRMAVPETVELFRIERMDGEAALHHRLDHGSVWNLDGNTNGVSLGAGPGQDPVGQRTQAGAAMLEAPVAQKRAVDVDNGCLVIAGPPVDADEEFDF